MLSRNKRLALLLAGLSLATTVHAQSPRENLQQMVEQLRATPSDKALRSRIFQQAAAIVPAPAVPTEAVRFEGRAQYAFRAAKSPIEFLDAAREYMKAIEVAPWVAGYYYDLCTILEKANRPAEAINACGFYLNAAPNAPDAIEVQKRVAGLDYVLERARASVANRHSCEFDSDRYRDGAKLAWIGNDLISMKLMSSLYGGVFRNQLYIVNPNTHTGQRLEMTPVDQTFQLNDLEPGTPYYRLTISSDGRITFGAAGGTQAEIVTSISELTELRNTQIKGCQVFRKGDKFFVLLGQGGSLTPRDGARVAGWLAFESDCDGKLTGDKPGWFPAIYVPHYQSPGVPSEQTDLGTLGFTAVSATACQSTASDLGWLAP